MPFPYHLLAFQHSSRYVCCNVKYEKAAVQNGQRRSGLLTHIQTAARLNNAFVHTTSTKLSLSSATIQLRISCRCIHGLSRPVIIHHFLINAPPNHRLLCIADQFRHRCQLLLTCRPLLARTLDISCHLQHGPLSRAREGGGDTVRR